MIKKLMTLMLIGAAALSGSLVLSYYNGSNSLMNPVDLSNSASIPPIDALAPVEVKQLPMP